MSATMTSPRHRASCKRRAWITVGFAILLVLAQLIASPVAAATRPESSGAFVPVAAHELAVVTGGCISNCDGGGSSDSGSSSSPSKVGGPYWEYAYRSLISRPNVPGDLIWHRTNLTDGYWGPFEVTYRQKETFNWSLGGSVPSWYVEGHIGKAYETSRTMIERFTIPPRTYYKFFVAYPYERWRYYYRKYQDYSDGSRQQLASGDATVYDQWTKATLVQGRAY